MVGRQLEGQVCRFLKQFPVVGLIGPRQVGKTTLARQLGKKWDRETQPPLYLDLELPSDVSKLQNAQLFLQSHQDRLVIIDEIQRMPTLFPLLRSLVDQHRMPGRFLILGSANLLALRQISESLAGRIIYLELTPLLRGEIGRMIPIAKHWFRGAYPNAVLAASEQESAAWLGALLQTYLERDLPGLGFRIAAPELRRFLMMLAHNHGQLWNAQQLAASFGVSPPTVTHYRSILEQMLLVRTLPPWHANIKKRLVKAPRVYLRDSGLLHSLLGVESHDDLLAHPIAGKSWEGFVIEQILGTTAGSLEAAFFRTHAGAEMDLVLHKGQKVKTAIEIKLGLTPQIRKGLHEASKDLGAHQVWVIYSGEERFLLSEGLEVIGLDELLKTIERQVAQEV